MKHVYLAVACALCIGACFSPDHLDWSKRQRGLAHKLREAHSLAGWVVSSDTISLTVPESIRVDVLPHVVATRHNFFLCNPIGRSIVRVSRDGKFLGKFGNAGSGPGEFRSIVTAAADSLENLYVFDNLLARISWFSADGELLGTSSVHNPFLVRHLCPIRPGSLYLHHAPDSAGGGFVTLVERGDRATSMVRSPRQYEAYYYRGHLEGGFAAGEDGSVFESNTYAPEIRRIRGREITARFGEECDGFSPLPASRGFGTIHELQKAVMNATLVKGLFLVARGELLMQEMIRFSAPGRPIERRLLVFDTSGASLGEIAGGTGEIETSDGDALVQVHNPFPAPGQGTLLPGFRLPRLVLLHVRGYGDEQ